MDGLGTQLNEREIRIALARRRRFFKAGMWLALGIVLLVAGIWWLVTFNRRSESSGPGMMYPEQGAPHVALGTPFSYNSNPPTSGPHFANPAEWGVYKEEIHDQVLIHNLEHGGVWISHRPGIDSAIIEKLGSFHHEFGRKIIVAPRQANDSDIALAAWNHLDKFSAAEFSEERVREFIKAYRNKGPEFVP